MLRYMGNTLAVARALQAAGLTLKPSKNQVGYKEVKSGTREVDRRQSQNMGTAAL